MGTTDGRSIRLPSAKIDLYGEFALAGLKYDRVCASGLELVYTEGLNPSARKGVRVRIPPSTPNLEGSTGVQRSLINSGNT